MMSSLEQFILPPPFSALVSLGMLAGLDALGLAFLTCMRLMQLDQQKSLRYQSPVLGAILVSALLFPLVLLGQASLILMRVAAGALLISGLLHLALAATTIAPVSRIKAWLMDAPLPRMLILTNLVGLFFLALGPVTSADALDYHIGGAIEMLNKSGMPASPEWFTSRLAGNGEVLIALGLAVGAEQFGALLQWASLMAITSLFWWKADKRLQPASSGMASTADLIVLAAISTPILLFLVSSHKPQLWPVAMTTLAFALFAHPSVEEATKPVLRKRFALVCMLCMSAALAKFNYLLGGGLVGCFALYTMGRRRDMAAALAIGSVLAVLIFLPAYIWKAHTYGSTLLEAILNPLPGHLPGTDAMIAYARNNPDFFSNLPFPLSILLPTDPMSLTHVLGIGWIVFLFALRPGVARQTRVALLLVATITLLSLASAPPSARMYLETYYWGLFICTLALDRGAGRVPLVAGWIVKLQAAAFMLGCWLGVYILFPGALAEGWREKIMERSANGYSLLRWADNALPPSAALLNGHRSMALSPRRAIDYSWISYVDPSSPEALPYLLRIKQANVTHILIPGPVTPSLALYGCFGKLFAGPELARGAVRNPFNQASSYYAWIYEFNSERLPECATR